MSDKSLSRTPLGRAVLHLKCLCKHPTAAGFHIKGLTRNLAECAVPANKTPAKTKKKQAGKKSGKR